MNTTDPQAAPPETDLRDELAAIIYEADFRSNFLVIADAVLAAGYRRPDALREKVKALNQQLHIDLIDARQDIELSDGESADLLQLEDVQDLIDAAFAAVAVVLEADHAD